MLLIKNGKILTMAGKEFGNGYVLVKDGKIAETGPGSFNAGADAEVIDARGGWVMPGLIESHCHIGITEEKKGFEGDDCNEMTEPIVPYLKALDAVNPMDSAFHNAVAAGITGVMTGPGSPNVVGGQCVFIKTHGRSIDEMVVLEPAAMKIAFGENTKTNYDKKGTMPTTRMSVGALLREELLKSQKYCEDKKKALEDGDSFEEDFELECWVPVFDGRIPLKAHVHRADDIQTAIRVAKQFGLRMTLDHCSDGHLIAGEIKESGCPAIVGPSMSSRNKIETQNMDFKTAGILHKESVLVSVMTDHPVTRIQYLPICAGFAAKEGLGVEEGLKAITINAAKICNVSHRVGSLEAGKDADIAVFDGNPMETFTNCLFTVIDGSVVHRLQQS